MKDFRRIKPLLTAVISAAAFLALHIPAASAAESDGARTFDDEEVIVTQFGDVNLDQFVGISDAVQLQRFLLGQSEELGSWKNADIDEDGVVDSFDFTLLRKQLTGKAGNGGTLDIKVVDMVTGEPINNVDVSVVGLYDDRYFDVVNYYHYNPDVPMVLTGLPTDDKYTYMIELCNLPGGYGSVIGNWDQQMFYKFGDNTEKELTVRVLSNNAKRNVKINLYDWANGMSIPYYCMLNVTDKNGDSYYPTLRYEDIYLPDGEYHADITLFDYPVQLMDPDSDFAKHIKEIYPNAEFSDKSGGLDFVVKDGKADRELTFDFSPKDGKSNYIEVSCIDGSTGKPLEGVELSVIEAPKEYAMTVEKWTSGKEKSKIVGGLVMAGPWAYKLQVDKVPEGYTGGYDEYFHWGEVNEYKSDITYVFYPETEPKLISADIVNIIDNTVMNELGTFEIWKINDNDPARIEKVTAGVKAGEKFTLKDGSYLAGVGSDVRDNGYVGVSLLTEKGKELANGLNEDEFFGNTAVILFTVKDGKADRDLVFYVKEYDPADDIVEVEEEEDASLYEKKYAAEEE
ncbi:MAG: dockerin type I repeat-containing protein [Ruminococcus sp.]|nr:dockerin type I repeat-containing protein [Ruminococcus sp.]